MFNIPKTGHLYNVDQYVVKGRLMAVFSQSTDLSEIYCVALPDCEFTGNQLRKFYKYAYEFYGLSKSDFYGPYFEHDGCYERTIEGKSEKKHLFNVGSEAYVKAIAEEWKNCLW